MTDITQILPIARDVTITGALLLALIGGHRGWYVWRWQHDELRREKDDWKRIALRGLNIAEQVVPK